MLKSEIIEILKDYNCNKKEISVALQLLNIVTLKNVHTGWKPENRISNYFNYSNYSIFIDIYLDSKFARVYMYNANTEEEFTLVEDDLENFFDTINYDIDDITNILNSFSNLNDDRY